MNKVLDTSTVGSNQEEKHHFWRQAISSVVYDLDLDFCVADNFRGLAESWTLGDIQWTRIISTPVQYQRQKQHYDGCSPQILLCIPLTGATEFTQFGKHINCRQGQFMLEYSNEPYQFAYHHNIDLWAIRIPESLLKARIRNPTRFCAMNFDGRVELEKFFLDYLNAIESTIKVAPHAVGSLLGTQLTDLLTVVLEGDKRVLNSTGSSIKAAHLLRIEQYLRSNLKDAQISPLKVASACNISVRYLHLLLQETGMTFSKWVRENRLQLAYECLNHEPHSHSISQLAYKLGFNDHAQFTRAFRKKFGCTPTDILHNRF